MVSLIRPRNEAEFVHELKTWFLENPETKDRTYFQMTGGASGMPDFIFGCLDRDGVTRKQFHAECKYVDKMPNTMRGVLGLMRDIQLQVCLKMAAAGFQVYLIVCVGGKEALWYFFNSKMSYDALHGKRPKYQACYLKYVSHRNNQGKWVIGDPADKR